MIRTVFWQDAKDPSRLVGFDVKGHADFGEAGHDLLCAAVSGIVTAALNTFQEATDFGDRVQIRCNEGDVSLRVEQSLETSVVMARTFSVPHREKASRPATQAPSNKTPQYHEQSARYSNWYRHPA